MSTSTSASSWAKLISQDPDKDDILLLAKPNEPKCFKMKDEWVIYQSAEASTAKIINLSTSKIKIDFTWLKLNEDQMLVGGEMITFYDQEKMKKSDYIFVLMKRPKNDLKRNKLFKDSLVTMLRKSVKVQKEENLKEDHPCPICQGTLHNPVTTSPCGHHFCSGCLSENVKFSTKCSVCQEEILSFQKDPPLNALIDQNIKRSEEERLSLDEKDFISKGYQIIRDEDGVYFGECLNGKKHGEGKITYKCGTIYQGMWKDGKREGKGTVTGKRGHAYEGDWSDGFLKKSNVKITFPNGNLYSGEIERLLMHGQGILTFHNGDEYRGEFVKGKIEGIGAYFFQNGDRYIGAFVNQMKHGYGQMVYANGDVYEGHWEDDKKDGEGIFKYCQGLEFQGQWKNDESVGKGKFICGEYVLEGKWEKF